MTTIPLHVQVRSYAETNGLTKTFAKYEVLTIQGRLIRGYESIAQIERNNWQFPLF